MRHFLHHKKTPCRVLRLVYWPTPGHYRCYHQRIQTMITNIPPWFQSLWHRNSCAFWVLCCFLCSPSTFSADWTTKRHGNEVTVFARETLSGYYEIAAQTDVRTDILALPRLLDDVNRGPSWIDHAKNVSIIAAPNPAVRVVRTHFFAPWPVNDRDMITHSVTQLSADRKRLDIWVSDASHTQALNNDTVRITSVRGHWEVIKLDEQWLRIRYQGYAEPGGNLPLWLSNRLSVSSTFQTFVNMRNLLTEPRYQSDAAAEITD